MGSIGQAPNRVAALNELELQTEVSSLGDQQYALAIA